MPESLPLPQDIRSRTWLCILTVCIILILDQWLKIWVKTNMQYGDEFNILGLSWARIHFVENEGMAFGISLGGNTGKLFLSLFRIIAIGFLGYIIYRLIRSREKTGLLFCFSLILAGAIGNILDSVFYGRLFTESYYQGGLATYDPSNGYAPILFGKVVDMFYFPLIDTTWPSWVPWLGGKSFQFFKPVFNVADAAISTGVISMIVFYRDFFKSNTLTEDKKDPATIPDQNNQESEETESEKTTESTVEASVPGADEPKEGNPV
jgi:signal peptidase II